MCDPQPLKTLSRRPKLCFNRLEGLIVREGLRCGRVGFKLWVSSGVSFGRPNNPETLNPKPQTLNPNPKP